MELAQMTLAQLREMAKERGLTGISGLKKQELIDRLDDLIAADKARAAKKKQQQQIRPRNNQNAGQRNNYNNQKKNNQQGFRNKGGQRKNNYSYRNQKLVYHDGSDGIISIVDDKQFLEVHPTEIKNIDSGTERVGILEIVEEGYGFLRGKNYLSEDNDVYVSSHFIKRFGLKTGDVIRGNLRVPVDTEKFRALLYMKEVNGRPPSYLYDRKNFEDLTPIFPNERIHLETPDCPSAMRIMDLISPIGKGQRGMIVSQPKTGKTTLLKQVARAIGRRYPKMHLMVLLIDERPEEVTDIKESIEGPNVEVIYSTFDEEPRNHIKVAGMVLERAKRLAESGDDVVVLLDSITRYARANNLFCEPSGRTLSGGLDPSALLGPKKFFGAARNIREGGSLTILATALVDTGSRMDDVIFEEFKGTGNMEIVLDRSLSEKRIFPAIDIQKSSTRREDLLLNDEEQQAVLKVRKALSGVKTDQAMEQILDLFRRTKDNVEFVETVKKMHLR
ncbi:MAG: transcription termination factor Rho [Eubacterium sp.]|nr:transcription termination factor Rho [Eubacterium sp.]